MSTFILCIVNGINVIQKKGNLFLYLSRLLIKSSSNRWKINNSEQFLPRSLFLVAVRSISEFQGNCSNAKQEFLNSINFQNYWSSKYTLFSWLSQIPLQSVKITKTRKATTEKRDICFQLILEVPFSQLSGDFWN